MALFTVSVMLIILAGLAIIAYIIVMESENAVLLIAAVGSVMTGTLTALLTLIAILVQVRTEVNHKFDLLLQSQRALNFNRGMSAAQDGDSTLETGEEFCSNQHCPLYMVCTNKDCPLYQGAKDVPT